MTRKKKILLIAGIAAAALLIAAAAFLLWLNNTNYGFARSVPSDEMNARLRFVATAEHWLDTAEGSDGHHAIIDLYNSHEPLAQGYVVTYDDDWCATFVSAAAISCDLTEQIPTECGCQRQIGLFQELDRWVEDDGYTPLPGDIIYYCGSDRGPGDCTGWSDHVGIVVGTASGFIKVIEGNYRDGVHYRIIPIDAPGIRGYGTPDFVGAVS